MMGYNEKLHLVQTRHHIAYNNIISSNTVDRSYISIRYQ